MIYHPADEKQVIDLNNLDPQQARDIARVIDYLREQSPAFVSAYADSIDRRRFDRKADTPVLRLTR